MAKKASASKSTNAKPKYDWPENIEKRSLFVTLNPKELEQASRQLAATVPQIANLEREAKSSASQWKSRIEMVQCEQNKYSNIVSDGKEERSVECRWIYECSGIDSHSGKEIYHPEKKTLVRNDTGEVIEVRDISSEDRQISLLNEADEE